jgi:hypothetical protein
LPASGRPSAFAFAAVPSSVTPFSSHVVTKAVSGFMTSRTSARASSSTFPVAIAHAPDEVRLDADAAVGKDAVGRGHLEQGDLEGAERHRGIGREVRGDAQSPRAVDDRAVADLIEQRDRDDVARFLEAPRGAS